MTGRTRAPAIHGDVDERFVEVADVFASTIDRPDRVGGAVAVYLNGRPVVDLWGGLADRRTGRTWDTHTSTVMFSCTKGVMAIVAYHLVERGLLRLDAPVTDYWPGFGQNGKGSTTVRMLLSHQAGLPVVDRPLTREQALSWTPVIEALEAQVPLWEPGTAHTYHAKTYGWLVGEVIHRITGMTPGAFLRLVLARPFGLELWVGLPLDRQADVAQTEPPPVDTGPGDDWTPEARAVHDRALTLNGAFPFPDTDGVVTFNDPIVRAAELPGGNGIGTARSLARLYGGCVRPIDGRRVITDASIEDALVVRSSGRQLYGSPIGGFRWGTGFQLDAPPWCPMLGPRSFGHDGAGGQMALADADAGVGFAYLTAQMGGPDDRRAARLVDALRSALSR